ncbi:glutathione S-transferase family protein [Pelagibacterium xiamenense]|uniref:glutathione S-transferase family protein n=1 Tax=Pelagibacterium xiamenense TaxID=2901140 RepID=UPI001E305DC0|nr:glutathione S-transferase family protein [Pelagibacterium xiamenense]MCD7059857.1 glutathione S-transferase family protein [Pelagibacterium xiamenense]
MIVWGRKTSSNVQALMWCIGELGLDCVRHDVGHIYGGNDTPEFLAMNPNGKVPVLKDGDQPPIWETGAIIRYLAARYGDERFWPTDDGARAQVDMWAEWAKINVTLGFTMPIFWRVVRTAPSQRDARAIAEATAKLDAVLGIAEARLAAHPFLAGAHFTPADIQFGHILYRYFDIDIDRPERPALEAYYARLEERQPYRDHVMVSYDELRVRD